MPPFQFMVVNFIKVPWSGRVAELYDGALCARDFRAYSLCGI
jgi:hypothetical protein